ncbi:hypothetical protein JCM8547_004149 [Rhodosporidiobolus lusitaniae]
MSRQPFGMPKAPQHDLQEQPMPSLYDPFFLTSRPGAAGSSNSAVAGKSKKERSQSPGFLGLVGLAQPTLQISLAQDVFFLHPSAEGIPTDDEMVNGTVTLYLPKPRTLKHLTVRLIGRYDIGWNDASPYESGTILERTVSLLGENEPELPLEKGEHVFEFMIIVPANSACYERCQYGRVRHSITAKAKGLGLTGGDLMSNERPVFLIINPGLEEASKPPPPLHLKFEGSLEEIGPYSMSLQSQHIMVGGLLLFRLSLLFPPMDLFIYSIKVKILQQFQLRSPVDRTHSSTPPPSPQTVFILDSAHPPNSAKVQDEGRGARSGSATPRVGPLKSLRKDEMWNVIHLCRLPNDNHIRPSTPEGTETPITVHHTIVMELTYRPMTEEESNPPPFEGGKGKGKEKHEKEPERRKVVMSKPLDMFSCCCFLDSLTLPVYSVLDPNPMPLETELQLPCVCGMTLKRLIDKHANALLIDGGEDTTIEYVAPPKPDGILPSPSIERPPHVLWEDGDDEPPLSPVEERERGRSQSRRVSPAQSREPSASRFFRVGSSSDRLFAMAGWRSPSSSGRDRDRDREGGRDHSTSESRGRGERERGRSGREEMPEIDETAVAQNLSGLTVSEPVSRVSSMSRLASIGETGGTTSSASSSRAPSRSSSRVRGGRRMFSFGGDD